MTHYHDYEQITYETDSDGVTEVYGWARDTKRHLQRYFLATFPTVEQMRLIFPQACDTHPAFED